MVFAQRLTSGPIVAPTHSASLGFNLNGPSLAPVPDWAPGALGRFYLYFAHHEGRFIRMAYADRLEGPWRVHEPGVLHLGQTPLPEVSPDVPQPEWAVRLGVDGLYPHVASPDVHVDDATRRFHMWFHGLDHDGEQRSLRATSRDGLNWTVVPKRFAPVYMREFRMDGQPYALAHGGKFWRLDGADCALCADLFPATFRHGAVMVLGKALHVFWTAIGDAPERIYHSTVAVAGPVESWQLRQTSELLRPELVWEGAELPPVPSQIGTAQARENGLRDPCIFRKDDRVFMIYAGAGEAALGLAEITGLT